MLGMSCKAAPAVIGNRIKVEQDDGACRQGADAP